ncbi:MAG: SMC-Scp complex subunit ScpB [Desulfuromonas sp.]|nr:MAG: SMC-Scp complex subunit ScpB [Desulfuromonas sp.]
MATSDIRKNIEALVFVSESPIKVDRIAEILEMKKSDVKQVLQELQNEYVDADRGILLEEVSEGFQFRTRQECADVIQQLIKSRPFRFSRAALETLAIVAYRQQVTRAEVEYLRGVDSGGVFKTLLEKQLIRILGKKDVPGRPLIYGTSKEFLEFFGMRDLSALPTLKEFSDLAEELPETETGTNAKLVTESTAQGIQD